ncbi:SET domain-containing protein 4 [Anoplophora glabripennis]|uniref:SET domain-containing protein 4 n=1 Tax=Anoplophora glabripennis TaxID=217634 RepID=UPI0008751793|nr:SET domain-containing protein 4 [Anoplophora glabripennis]
MGRTRRLRLKRKHSVRSLNMDNELTTINLTKWLVDNNWRNDTNLRLRGFPETGRGVTSSRQIKENDILIAVPCDLMITYNTLQENLQEMISPRSHGLKIHDLLTLFLMNEKRKDKSLWRAYMDSLPSELPLLPWLAPTREINLYPLDLRIISEKTHETFTESMSRVKKSISKVDGCVFDENLFKWGYVLVNTRAVYFDPKIVKSNQQLLENVLIDQPSMALCPFLDMFNHHFLAMTEAEAVEKEGKLVYRLKTFTEYKRYDQIFISYGSHDNIKLLMEYGFFIPGNNLDVVVYDLQNLLDVFSPNLDQKRYKFIMDHGFNSDLYIGYLGISFNLKAVLFVFFCEQIQDYSAVIFSDIYPEDFLLTMSGWILELLDYKLTIFESDYNKLKDCGLAKSGNAKLMEDFLKYRTVLVNDLRNKLCIQ